MDDIFATTINKIIKSDGSVENILPLIKKVTSQFQKDETYELSAVEAEIITNCKKHRNQSVLKIIGGGLAMSALGLVFNARGSQIIQWSLLLAGTLALHEWEEGYGHCIMGLCQVPQAILPSEIRRLVFKHHGHSKTAEFLKELGYDEKNLISPNVEVPDPIDESKATPLTQKNVMENAFISTFVNSAYRFFPRTNSLTVKQYDDKLITITIANPDNVEQGRIHHIRGTMKEVLTALRRVNISYQYTEKHKTGEIEKLVSMVESAGGAYHGSVVVIHGAGVSDRMDYGGSSSSNNAVFKKPTDLVDKPPSLSSSTTTSSRTTKLKRQQEQMQKQEEQRRVQEAMLLAARLEREQREVRGYDKRMEKNTNSMKEDYHGTGIAPAERDERDHYHGTGIAPAERDERDHYHGTGIAPAERDERDHYHETGIAPAERDERDHYYGTGIAPAERDDFERITSWNDNQFDVNKYIQRNDDWRIQQTRDEENSSIRYSGRYVSHVDRRREERRHQPTKHRTWEDIRRQS